MINILKKFKINIFTYIYLIICFTSGFIKESLIIFGIVIIHEFGHIIANNVFKYEIEMVTLYPFGGITKVNKLINTPVNRDIIIYSGGLISQILFAFIFNLLFKDYSNLINIFNYYNKIILIFNILPIYPLDGFYIFKNIIEKNVSFYRSSIVMTFISIIALILFLIISKANQIVIIFLIMMILKYILSFKYIYNKFLLERLIYNLNSKKIIYNNKINLFLLRRDSIHFFKKDKKLIKERQLLAKLFDINDTFW